MSIRLNCAGLVKLQVGDVVTFQHRKWIVDYANESRARVIPMERVMRVVKTRFERTKTFAEPPRSENIARCVDPECFTERRGVSAVKNFLPAKTSRQQATQQEAVDNQTNTNNSMKKKEVKDKTKARGGLAADMAQDKKKNEEAAAPERQEGTTTKGELGSIFGHSTTSVLRRLGAEGVSAAHAREIIKAQGIKASPTTVQIQIGNGRNKKGVPADLSKEQLKELIASASEPVQEPKPKKEKKSKKGGKESAAKATEPAAVAA